MNWERVASQGVKTSLWPVFPLRVASDNDSLRNRKDGYMGTQWSRVVDSSFTEFGVPGIYPQKARSFNHG